MSIPKKEVESNLPEKLSLNELCLVDLNKQANIKKLKKELSKKLIPNITSKDDEGYELVKEKLKLSLKARTGIEKTRKEHKAEALAYGKFVDGSAAELQDMVLTYQKPWKDLKESIDKAEEIKAEQERQAEIARTEEIEKKVNYIVGLTDSLLGANSELLAERLNLAQVIVVDETFEEYEDVALQHKTNAITVLQAALTERQAYEVQQEELEKGKRELAEAQAEIARLKVVNNVSDNTLEIESPPIDSVTDTWFGEDLSKSTEVKSGDVEPYINLTEPQMVVDYINRLKSLETPDVGDEAMVNLVLQITSTLEKLAKFVDVNTQ